MTNRILGGIPFGLGHDHLFRLGWAESQSMPLAALTRKSHPLVEQLMSLSRRVSDGDVLCTGCWDRSDHNTGKDNTIPAGHQIWYPRYNDEPYCRRCAFDTARWLFDKTK